MTPSEAIKKVYEKYTELANSGNATGLVEFYTEDAALMAPGSPRLVGRDAIRENWQNSLDGGVGDISLNTTEVLDGGDIAVETGTLSSTGPGEDGSRVSKTGKFIVVWKRDESGSWRIHRDIWNFDA